MATPTVMHHAMSLSGTQSLDSVRLWNEVAKLHHMNRISQGPFVHEGVTYNNNKLDQPSRGKCRVREYKCTDKWDNRYQREMIIESMFVRLLRQTGAMVTGGKVYGLRLKGSEWSIWELQRDSNGQLSVTDKIADMEGLKYMQVPGPSNAHSPQGQECWMDSDMIELDKDDDYPGFKVSFRFWFRSGKLIRWRWREEHQQVAGEERVVCDEFVLDP